MMGYARALLIIAMLFAHTQGNAAMVFIAYMVNVNVLDNLDGIVARRLGQCTSLGRVLDIGLDVCSEAVLLSCIYAAFADSYFVPHFMQNFGLWSCIALDRCAYVVGCFGCIAITFAGSSWKEVRYPCPITRWYYETKVGEYSLYIGYHTFLATLYLFAHGFSGSAVLLAITAPAALLRWWTSYVGNYQVAKILMEADAKTHMDNQ